MNAKKPSINLLSSRLELLEDHVTFRIHGSMHATALLLALLSELLCYTCLLQLALVLRECRLALRFCLYLRGF